MATSQPRRMTPEEEAALAAEVEAHAGDEAYWDFDHPLRLTPPPTVAVTVELSPARYRQLARLAASHAESVDQFVTRVMTELDADGEFAAEPPATTDLPTAGGLTPAEAADLDALAQLRGTNVDSLIESAIRALLDRERAAISERGRAERHAS